MFPVQKVLIAHKSEAFAADLAKRLQTRYEVHICPEDTDVLSLIDSLKPDMLVIYLPLVCSKGKLALKDATFQPPVILALTNIVTDSVCRDATAAGIKELITIPCTIDHTIKRLESLLNENIPSPKI